jgi:hypothetical protein
MQTETKNSRESGNSASAVNEKPDEIKATTPDSPLL